MKQIGPLAAQASRTPSSKNTFGRQRVQSTTQVVAQRMPSYSAWPTSRGESRSSMRTVGRGGLSPLLIAFDKRTQFGAKPSSNGHSISTRSTADWVSNAPPAGAAPAVALGAYSAG